MLNRTGDYPVKRAPSSLRLCIDHQSPLGCLLAALIPGMLIGIVLVVTEQGSNASFSALGIAILALGLWGAKSSSSSNGRLDMVYSTVAGTIEVPDLGEAVCWSSLWMAGVCSNWLAALK